jgi:hypothetical protein
VEQPACRELDPGRDPVAGLKPAQQVDLGQAPVASRPVQLLVEALERPVEILERPPRDLWAEPGCELDPQPG